MFGRKEYIIIAVVWLLIGLLSVISICVYEMRGEPYDENYFKGEILNTIIIILTGGCHFLLSFILSQLIFFKKYMKNENERVIEYSQNSFIK